MTNKYSIKDFVTGLQIIRMNFPDILIGADTGIFYVYTDNKAWAQLEANSFAGDMLPLLNRLGWKWNDRFLAWTFLLD